MLQCCTVSQTINYLRTRVCAHKFIHIHMPHTLLEPQSLIHCCHGNPIKGGQSGNNSGEISLSLFYLSLTCPFTHVHTPSFSFTASHFYLSPTITLSLPHPLSFSPLLLASPLAHLSARLSPLLCCLFIFSPPASHFSGECKYVILPLQPSWCLYLIFGWSSSALSFILSLSLSLSHTSNLRETE